MYNNLIIASFTLCEVIVKKIQNFYFTLTVKEIPYQDVTYNPLKLISLVLTYEIRLSFNCVRVYNLKSLILETWRCMRWKILTCQHMLTSFT